MSSKIDFRKIVKDHFGTLTDVSGKRSSADYFVFVFLPFVIAVISVVAKNNLSEEVVSMLVNFGSIFTALLLSVLMLVYEQQNKLEDRHAAKQANGGVAFFAQKKKLLEQLYSNISYAVVASMLLVLFSFVHTMLDGKEIPLFAGWYFNLECRFSIYVLTPILLFLTVNLILTIFMVVKRTYSLLGMKL